MTKEIYVCATYYHILITIIKALKSENEISIVIQNTVPDADKFIPNLKKAKLFKEIFLYDEVGLVKEYVKQKIEFIYFRKDELINIVESDCDIDFTSYDDVYIYNDWTTLGAYFIDKKIYYHLIEDGLDTHHFLKDFLKKVDPYNKKKGLKNKIKKYRKKIVDAIGRRFFHRGYYIYGRSKYAIDVEVNNKKIVNFNKRKLKEVPRADLFASLTKKDKKIIYDIFVQKDLKLDASDKKILILTQPLHKDKLVPTEELQKKVYYDIIDKYYKDYVIYLKPHPRDIVTYNVKKYVFIIDKNIPTEVLSFDDNFKFNKAITISSGGLNNIKAEEKIQYGLDYLGKYQKND